MEKRQKNILVAMDASDHSFEAVRYVGRMMPAGEATVTLIHIMNVIPEMLLDLESGPEMRYQVRGFGAWEVLQSKMIQEFMDRATRLLMSMGYPTENVLVLVKEKEKGIARDIAAEARRGYDALVVGRRGISEVKDLVFGSTANKLVNIVHDTPVCVVGSHPDPGRLLVGMDSSESSTRAVEYVGDIFASLNPELLLLHVDRKLDVFQPVYEEFLLAEEGREWLENAKKALAMHRRQMESQLQECARKLEQKGIEPGRIQVKIAEGSQSRSAAIHDEARRKGYGTIVLGRRGISKVEEFIMGRVSSKVLQLARDAAVWIVH